MTEVNLSNMNCVKYVENIGGTIVHNVCDGSQSWVPWGHLFWLEFSFILLFMTGFVTLVSWLFYKVFIQND